MNEMINQSHSRRDFLKRQAALTGGVLLYHGLPLSAVAASQSGETQLDKLGLLGGLKQESTAAPLKGASWYLAHEVGDGMEFAVEPGSLSEDQFLFGDLLLDDEDLAVFQMTLTEAGEDKGFNLRFGLIAQCSARMRIPLSLVDMNRWRLEREGAWLKPICGGRRVNLAKVDRIRFAVHRKSSAPVRWCMTNPAVSTEQVPMQQKLVLPKGKLLDELGQSTLHEWPEKSRNVQEVTQRLKQQLKQAPQQQWPKHFNQWGGWKDLRFEATGFFRTQFADGRWWLVDPAGHAYWSAGCDCVRSVIDGQVSEMLSALEFVPKQKGRYASSYSDDGRSINFLGVNFIRAFGPQAWKENWATITMAELRRIGFNTVANWSEWTYAKRESFPYVRPMSFSPKRIKLLYRDFPDVFDPEYRDDAADYASQLSNTADDPALIGYFLMNEPKWGFSPEFPAEGMLQNNPDSHTRRALAAFLKERYGSKQRFARAWNVSAGFDDVARGKRDWVFNEKALDDLEAFSEEMVVRFFGSLHNACKQVDPNHMNLGIRYAGVPKPFSIKGMSSFDVFSMNSYSPSIPTEKVEEITKTLNMPTMIGEYHFGALDAGMPASGIGHVPTQVDRGKAYRIYLEDAAANPNCVGVHWFTLYDQSALGRFDGENYNIGFLDICNRPYTPLCDAARKSHEAMYAIASGKQQAYADAPEYLPKLFL